MKTILLIILVTFLGSCKKECEPVYYIVGEVLEEGFINQDTTKYSVGDTVLSGSNIIRYYDCDLK